MKKKVLFVCVHNSARSQMAEAFLKHYGADGYEAESAGFEPTSIDPLVVEVMAEAGIDISKNITQSVFELYRAGRFFGYIITVCSRARESDCPTFPGIKRRLHWELENPEDYEGTREEKIERLRILRDRIKELVLDFIRNEK